MSHRTDPAYYDVEIEEIKTGKVNRSQVGCWWTGVHSSKGLHGMCDCQLAGYFHAESRMIRDFDGQDRVSWANAFATAQQNYLKTSACKHGPAKKFRPVRAILPSGEVVELSEKIAA
jgi:hypothetical protein